MERVDGCLQSSDMPDSDRKAVMQAIREYNKDQVLPAFDKFGFYCLPSSEGKGTDL
jgi:hypothetical protein